MSRNGSGTYTKVNTFVASNPITASGHNQNWDDLATEMTNSVAADGQTSMTGPLKAASGTVSAPGVTFASDTNTGLYRIGADNLGIAANGAKVVDVATTGVTVTGDVDATTVKQGGFALLPVGVMWPYGGASAPSGYLLCDGTAVSRTTYAALFAIIGTSYGVGNGSTTFNLPDMKGRVPAGKEASATRLTSTYFGGDSTALGATGGSESHTLTRAQIPTGITSTGTATGIGSSGNVIPTVTSGAQSDLSFSPSGAGSHVPSTAGGWSFDNNTLAGSASVTSNNTSGNAHNNTQPTIIVNYIIFAGV
jgi:microcystin-dependent protein